MDAKPLARVGHRALDYLRDRDPCRSTGRVPTLTGCPLSLRTPARSKNVPLPPGSVAKMAAASYTSSPFRSPKTA